jgi:hypothetical protein
VTVAALRRRGMVTRYFLGRVNVKKGGGRVGRTTYPKEYRAWTSCLRPVLAPAIPMNAGGMQVSMAKKRMTSDASLRLMPNDRVASKPVGMLGAVSVFLMPMFMEAGRESYGSRFKRQVKKMVKRLLYWVLVRYSSGTGLMPFSSTPASSSF